MFCAPCRIILRRPYKGTGTERPRGEKKWGKRNGGKKTKISTCRHRRGT
jgi:hypothetical protein